MLLCLLVFMFYLLKLFFCCTSWITYLKFGSPYLGKAKAGARAALPISNSACGIFVCPNKLPVFEIFNVRTDDNAGGCAWGMYGHRKRVCTECWLREKNPFSHLGIEPASPVCRSDALPTDLHRPPRAPSCKATTVMLAYYFTNWMFVLSFIRVCFFSASRDPPFFFCSKLRNIFVIVVITTFLTTICTIQPRRGCS